VFLPSPFSQLLRSLCDSMPGHPRGTEAEAHPPANTISAHHVPPVSSSGSPGGLASSLDGHVGDRLRVPVGVTQPSSKETHYYPLFLVPPEFTHLQLVFKSKNTSPCAH
jgi:hypothetical protein